MKAPERVETERFVLRKPALADARAIFSRYASDPEVTRFMSWPTHRSLDDTMTFLNFSESEWERWPAGPYLIESRDGLLLGSTGVTFENTTRAETGYILAKDAWGKGYATEALKAVVELAPKIGLRCLHATYHPANTRSAHVLEKCGFIHDGVKFRGVRFPNLESGLVVECPEYRREF